MDQPAGAPSGPATPPAAPTEARPIQPFAIEFTGSGGEYFRVWIVNLLLTIVTASLYTPFARRRTAQYFYGHTLVAGSPLEFVAQQRRMVLGFLLLAGLYLAFDFFSRTGQDAVVAVFLLAGAVLAPYFWGSAMRFRLNATRWRGVRLQFAASWSEVYRASWPVFVLALVWIGFSLGMGLLFPDEEPTPAQVAAVGWQLGLGFLLALALSLLCIVRLEFNYKSLLVARGRIGGQAGRWKPVYADFVRIWMATAGVFLLSLLVVGLLLGLGMGSIAAVFRDMRHGGLLAMLFAILATLAAILLLFLASAPARAYREARMFQLVWNNIGVSHIARFKCRLKVRRYVGLRVRNLALTLLTLGFFRPFALVSEYRMKAESVTLHVKGGLDQLAGQLASEEQGLGDALADAVGLDLVG